MPQVSIILPNYNYARYLSQRIDSILNQTFSDFELIILDDASTDNSKEIIKDFDKKDERIKTVFNTINSGNPFVQWQKGIELAKGNLIWIAEADDWCETDFLASILSHFENNDKLGLCFCQSVIADEIGNKLNEWQLNSSNYFDIFENKSFINAIIHENIIPNASAVLFEKKIYEKVGGVDISLSSNADWLLWFKIACYSEIDYENKALNYFRRHPNSVISKIAESEDSYIEKYDYTMRKLLEKFVNYHKIRFDKKILKENNKYIAYDMGHKAIWLLNKRKYFSSFDLLFRSSVLLRSFGFIKKALKILFVYA